MTITLTDNIGINFGKTNLTVTELFHDVQFQHAYNLYLDERDPEEKFFNDSIRSYTDSDWWKKQLHELSMLIKDTRQKK